MVKLPLLLCLLTLAASLPAWAQEPEKRTVEEQQDLSKTLPKIESIPIRPKYDDQLRYRIPSEQMRRLEEEVKKAPREIFQLDQKQPDLQRTHATTRPHRHLTKTRLQLGKKHVNPLTLLPPPSV